MRKAIAGLAGGLGIGLVGVVMLWTAYNIGRTTEAQRIGAAQIESAPSAPTAPMPDPAPSVPVAPVDPLRPLVIRATREVERFRGFDDRGREAALRQWAPIGEPSFAVLQRGADAHFGERVCYRGTVEEIQDTTSGSVLRLSVRGVDDVLWVESLMQPSDEVLARSRALVCGYLVGTHTYESQAGWTITLPFVMAVWVEPQPRR